MKAKRVIAGALIPLALFCLPGCSMLPEEEEFRSAPVIRDYQEQEYETTTVKRGDLALTQSLYCRYEPVKEENLSFGVGGVYYEGVYVQKGDYVTAGTLLAELQMGSLKDEIANCESELARLELVREQTDRMQQLQLNRHSAYLATLDATQLESAQTLDELRRQLDQEMQAQDDAIYIQQLKLAELEQQRDQRQIVAGMDGTVMYVRTYDDGDTSTENATFIKLSDTESSMFSVETEYYDFLHPGDTFDITCSKVVYPAQVVTAAELGIAEPEPNGEKRTVFLKLLEPAVDLESGDRGTLTLTLDTREDVLYVDSKAISTADGKSFVYYIDEQGMRRMQEITTGLETGKLTEILSGLDEGDEIILS